MSNARIIQISSPRESEDRSDIVSEIDDENREKRGSFALLFMGEILIAFM